ncbi:unnamed protein product, partial [Litomosoides sigmodontis]
MHASNQSSRMNRTEELERTAVIFKTTEKQSDQHATTMS